MNEHFVGNQIEQALRYWRTATYLAAAHSFGFGVGPLSGEIIRRMPSGHWGANPGIAWIVGHLAAFVNSSQPTDCFIGTGHCTSYHFAHTAISHSWPLHYINSRIANYCVPGGDPSEIMEMPVGAGIQFGELGPALAVSQGYASQKLGHTVACVIGDGELETPAALAALSHTDTILRSDESRWLPIVNLNGWKLSGSAAFCLRKVDKLLGGMGFECYQSCVEDEKGGVSLKAALERLSEGHRVAWLVTSEKGWPLPREFFGGGYSGHRAHKPPRRLSSSHQREILSWAKEFCKDTFVGGRVPDELVHTASGVTFAYGSNNGLVADSPYKDVSASFGPVSKVEIGTRAIGREVDAELAEVGCRVFCPDEGESNLLNTCIERGQLTQILSEETTFSWATGVSKAGRPVAYSTYEGFAPLISSQFAQLAKTVSAAKALNQGPLVILSTSLSWANCPSHQNTNIVGTAITAMEQGVEVIFPSGATSARGWIRKLFSERACPLSLMTYSKQSLLDVPDLGSDAVVISLDDSAGSPDGYLIAVGDIAVQESIAAAQIASTRGTRIKVVAVIRVGSLNGQCGDFIRSISATVLAGVVSFHPYFISGMLFSLSGRVFPVFGFRNISGANPWETLQKNGIDRYSVLEAINVHCTPKMNKDYIGITPDLSAGWLTVSSIESVRTD